MIQEPLEDGSMRKYRHDIRLLYIIARTVMSREYLKDLLYEPPHEDLLMQEEIYGASVEVRYLNQYGPKMTFWDKIKLLVKLFKEEK